MDSLPYEVLVHIFQYLPLSSRHQVRLVNRSWNSACNDPLITKEEVLSFLFQPEIRLSKLPDVFSSLLSTKRSILNLIFGHSQVYVIFLEDHASSDFWLNHGTKVRYLKFDWFYFDELDIAEILGCCPNLRELHCVHREGDPDFVEILNLLADNNVILTNVTRLSFANCLKKRCCSSEALLKVFPNVQDLSLVMRNGVYHPDIFDYILQISSQLKHFELSFCYPYSTNPLVLEKIMDVLAAAKQLETVKLPNLQVFTRQHLLQLSHLNNLTALSLDLWETDLSVSEFFEQMLDIFPKLRHLEITAYHGFGQINDNVLNKLSNSSLRSLKTVGSRPQNPIRDFGEVNVSQYQPNDTLEKLSMWEISKDDYSAANAVITFLMKFFRKLKHVHFSPSLSSTTFDAMRSHQENLESLEMNFRLSEHSPMDAADGDSNEYPTFQWFSFRQFEYLETLNLVIHRWFSSEPYSFSDFILPHLKHLRVRFVCTDTANPTESVLCPMPSNLINFLHAIERLPSLKLLKLEGYQQNIPHDLVARQCESHRNLRSLFFNSSLSWHHMENENYSAGQYTQLFNLFNIYECLRFVHHNELSLRKNICTNAIELSTSGSY